MNYTVMNYCRYANIVNINQSLFLLYLNANYNFIAILVSTELEQFPPTLMCTTSYTRTR